jgi:hypothetical protein
MTTNFKVYLNNTQYDLSMVCFITNTGINYTLNYDPSINDSSIANLISNGTYDTSYNKPRNLNYNAIINNINYDLSTFFTSRYVTFTTSQTYTLPSNIFSIAVYTIGGGGGGGGGGGSSGFYSGQGGGGGGSSFPVYSNINVINGINTITINVGGGGSGGNNNSTSNIGPGWVGNKPGTYPGINPYPGSNGTNGGNSYVTYNGTNLCISNGGYAGIGGLGAVDNNSGTSNNGGATGVTGGTNGTKGNSVSGQGGNTPGGTGGAANPTDLTFIYSNIFNTIVNTSTYGKGGNGSSGGLFSPSGSRRQSGDGTNGYQGAVTIFFIY